MIAPPIPPREMERLQNLREYRVLDTPPEPDFDGLAELAAKICEAPIALITFVDEKRQWFKARFGYDGPQTETARSLSFCAHALHEPDLFVVCDTAEDSRFQDHPLVAGGPAIRFYAGSPLQSPEGHAIGTLCVVDRKPRTLTETQRLALRHLGRQVMQVLQLRRRAAEAQDYALLTEEILDSLNSTVAVLDQDGVVLRLNDAWRRRIGVEQADPILQPGSHYLENVEAFAELSDPALGEGIRRGIRAVLDGFESQYLLEYCTLRAGQKRWFTLRVHALDHPPARAVITRQENTERKAAEDALQSNQLFLAKLIEHSGSLVFVKDQDGRYQLVNKKWEEVTRLKREQVLGRTDAEVFSSEDGERFRQADLEIMRSEEGRVIEEKLTDENRVRTFLSVKFPIRDVSGRATGLCGMSTEITERMEADEKVRQQAELLDKAQDAIIVRGLDQRISFWNKSAERLYGWTSEEAIGSSARSLLYDDPTAFLAATEIVLSTGEWVGEIEQRSQAGQRLTIEGRWTLVRDEQGNPKSILAINTDITERKKLEQQFMRAQRMESIGTLAGGIAHDLNNVLGPILMSIDVMRMKCPDREIQNLLSIIGSSARRGADMVTQVLSFARGMTGQRLKVPVRHLIGDVEKIVNETFLKHVQIRTRVSHDLWTVIGDATQLHQVLLNLCVNARDAMPQGGVLTVAAENLMVDSTYAGLHAEARVGPHIVLEVEDSGTGIAPDIIEKIFDPFFTTKDVGQGTGLGLSTTIAIARSHGGFIRVYSELNKGTKFKVYLPAITDASEADQNRADIEMPRGNGETILIIDDEASVRQVTQQTLEAFGYKIITACDGAEALAIYTRRGEEISLVLTDMMMPVMDGPAVIQVLKKLDPTLPIIAASGLSTDGQMARASNLGVKHFLPKPYTAEVLLKLLHQLLSTPAST